ncbi:MAG: trehalose-phosphatase [Hyphomonadaceae bacterium]
MRQALFLDLDGTLVDIVERPELTVADADLRRDLAALNSVFDGAVAILSGRTLADIERILGRNIEIVVGVHGVERRVRNEVVRNASADLSDVRQRLRRLVDRGALPAELEDKGHAIALHYRASPQEEAFVRAVAAEVAAPIGLQVLHGKMVVEILPYGVTKGTALKALLKEPQFKGRVPIVVGDDVTDEDAFEAANEAGGYSVLVGDPRLTKATSSLANAASVRAWLRGALNP